jgi:hypothetical protein
VEANGQVLVPLVTGCILGVVVLVAVFFQDELLKILDSLWRGAAGVTRPLLRRVAAGPVRGVRARLQAAMRRAAAEGRMPVRRGGLPAGPASAPVPEEPQVKEQNIQPTERSDVDLVESAYASELGEPAPVARPQRGTVGSREDAVGEPGARRRYSPASRLRLEAALHNFLARPGDVGSMDSLVRYLDAEFGPGLGVGLLEALRARGRVDVRRDPKNPTRLLVRLNSVRATKLEQPDHTG